MIIRVRSWTFYAHSRKVCVLSLCLRRRSDVSFAAVSQSPKAELQSKGLDRIRQGGSRRTTFRTRFWGRPPRFCPTPLLSTRGFGRGCLSCGSAPSSSESAHDVPDDADVERAGVLARRDDAGGLEQRDLWGLTPLQETVRDDDLRVGKNDLLHFVFRADD